MHQFFLFFLSCLLCFVGPVFKFCSHNPLFILKVIERIKENSELIEEYEKLATDLLEWIQITIVKLSDRNFANTLVGVQQQMLEFNQYRTQEKPPRSGHDSCERCTHVREGLFF